MRVYTLGPDGLRRVPGPADLQGVKDDLLVRGFAPEHTAASWAQAIGLAVMRGASVRRES